MTLNDIENNKNYNVPNDNNELNTNLLPKKKTSHLLNRSSNLDRLLFKLEKPSECFEENVYGLRAGDKYISLKNKIINKKNKIFNIN